MLESPNIVAMYRVKNEERWIKTSIESVHNICNEIIILDNGSTDKTVEICKRFSKVRLEIYEEAHLPFDDVKSKNALLQLARKREPEYILSLDGDEILQPNADKILIKELKENPTTDVFEFQFFHMTDNPNMYRYDGVYESQWFYKLFRLKNQPKDLAYEDTGFELNNHCPPIPPYTVSHDKPYRSKVKIYHYGFYDEKTRYAKYAYYQKLDPNSKLFDGYKSIIEKSGVFSGKLGLEFRYLPKGMYYENIK